MKIVTKKTIKKECWNLDYELVKWLNEHLKVFLETTKRDLNVKYQHFIVNGKEVKLETAIKKLIKITDDLVENCYTIDEMFKLKDEMYDILKQIHWYLWW